MTSQLAIGTINDIKDPWNFNFETLKNYEIYFPQYNYETVISEFSIWQKQKIKKKKNRDRNKSILPEKIDLKDLFQGSNKQKSKFRQSSRTY